MLKFSIIKKYKEYKETKIDITKDYFPESFSRNQSTVKTQTQLRFLYEYKNLLKLSMCKIQVSHEKKDLYMKNKH